MKRTFFVFGRTPKLAFSELLAFYPSSVMVLPEVSCVDVDTRPQEDIRLLGGTVKIAREVGQISAITAEELLQFLTPFVSGARIAFGISTYGDLDIRPSLYAELKSLLSARGVTARYSEPKHEHALSSVVVTKQRLTELHIMKLGEMYTVSVTEAVQDFEDWNTRDASRPAVDPHRGMLPPKVARMIVNIAIGGAADGKILLDPFCGVGTVLAEGHLRGAHVTGFDISEKAVAMAQKNIAWLRAEYGLLSKDAPRIEVGDAAHVSDKISPLSVDAIATEPFMGEQQSYAQGATLTPERIKNIIKGLEKLYIGCLKDWAEVVRPGGKIVIAFPAYATPRGTVSVKKVVDRCESLGYTLLTGPIEYSRPNAAVRREFYIFQKNYLWHT